MQYVSSEKRDLAMLMVYELRAIRDPDRLLLAFTLDLIWSSGWIFLNQHHIDPTGCLQQFQRPAWCSIRDHDAANC